MNLVTLSKVSELWNKFVDKSTEILPALTIIAGVVVLIHFAVKWGKKHLR